MNEFDRLSGGNINDVYRDADAVVRTAGPWTPSVHVLLRHVRSKGFLLAPEPIEIADGQERLQFFEGDTATDEPWPEWVWTDELLVAAALAARRFHDATTDLHFPDATVWRLPGLERSTLGDEEVFCHNDLAPYNVVTREGQLVGIIDWDLVAPGTRMWELAFMAWQWVPLHHPTLAAQLGWHADEPEQLGRRLRLLCDGYGLDTRTDVIDLIELIIERIEASRTGILNLAAQGEPAFVRLRDDGHPAHMAKTIAHISNIRETLREWLR